MTQPIKILCLAVFVVTLLLPPRAAAQGAPPAPSDPQQVAKAPKVRLAEAYGRLPLSFEANQGQTDGRVKFLSRSAGKTLFLTSTDAVLTSDKSSAMRMKLVGASQNVQAIGLDKLPGNTNYFLGSDPAKWHTGVPTYSKVQYRQIYPGVDLIYYGNQRELEYDFVVAPGADPSAIRMELRGLRRLSIDDEGNVVAHSESGEIKLCQPRIYQELDGKRIPVEGHYALKGHELRFQLGQYDSRRTLVIDPVIAYATYLGGSSADGGTGIAVDSSGNVYVTGDTLGGFPTTPGVVQPNATLTRDVFISKLNPTGTALIYSTYLGGSLENDAFGIAVDSSGSAYVTGQTISTDFPVTAGAFQPFISAGPDAFVTKLSPDGSSLVYSTYLGGNSNDTAFAIAVDSSGNAYVAGETQSANFPNIASVLNVSQPMFCDPTIAGGFDAFIVKVNPDGKSLAYSLYLGGSGTDRANGVAVDSSGNAYVTGNTDSTDFLAVGTCPNSLSWTNPGGTHGFVVKVNPNGTAFLYATELGGSGTDVPTSIAVTGAGQAYVAGATSSANFGSGNAGSLDAFVAWLDSSGQLLIAKTLGGSGFDAGRGIAVDPSGNVYVTGETNSTNFPVLGAFKSTYGGGNADVFVAEFDSSGTLLFSTYLGGSGTDTASIGGTPIAVDTAGNIYVTGSTTSTDFPGVNASSIQPTNAGGGDAFIAKLSAPNTPISNPPGSPVTVSPNSAVTVTFQGGVTQAGTTSAVNLGANCPPAPTGFQFSTPPVCYDISTTALFSGMVQVCISDPSVTANSRLVHFVAGSPVDITNLPVTPPMICGTTFSFSPFAIEQPTAPVLIQTTAGLSVSPNPAQAGQTVTFTAGVNFSTGTGTGSGGPAPTGSMTFFDGTTPLGTAVNLPTSGPAMFSISTLAAATHSITAQYSGDPKYASSTSPAVSLTVNLNAVSTGLAVSPNPAFAGQLVTLTSGVSATTSGSGVPAPTGSVTFLDSGTPISSPVNLPNSGPAMFTISTLAAGTHGITAQYNGDPNYSASTSSAVTLTVNKNGSSIGLSTSPNPSAVGQVVAFTSGVTGSGPTGTGSGAVPPPSGSVTFLVDGAPFGSPANLSNSGSAMTTVSTLALGNHIITAQYSGDANYSASTSAPVTQTVTGGSTSTSISTTNVTYGTSATATVSVSSSGGTVTGTVTLSVDGQPSSMTLFNGSASFALGVLNAGSHNLVASFAAQGSFLASTGNLTLAVARASLTITANNATKILDAPNPSPFGWTPSGFVNGDNATILTANPTCLTPATTTSPVGSYVITCSGAAAGNYTFAYVAGTLKIQYSTSIGHVIQPPINADGTSVLKQGRVVPAKFDVYDANGVPISTPGVVSSFFLTAIVSGTVTTSVEDVVDTNNPDTAFRWDGQEWIFNITTGNLSAGSTYIYTITLNDGSTIVFQYGLR